jgi:hypothetical protein
MMKSLRYALGGTLLTATSAMAQGLSDKPIPTTVGNKAPRGVVMEVLIDWFTNPWFDLLLVALVVLIGVFFYVRNKSDDDD